MTSIKQWSPESVMRFMALFTLTNPDSPNQAKCLSVWPVNIAVDWVKSITARWVCFSVTPKLTIGYCSTVDCIYPRSGAPITLDEKRVVFPKTLNSKPKHNRA